MSTHRNQRQALWQFHGWQFAFNAVLFNLIGIRYLVALFPIELAKDASLAAHGLLWFFLVISHIGQFTLLALLGSFLIPALLSACLPARRLMTGISIAFGTVCLVFILIDSHLFSLYRFHLNETLLKMAFSVHVTQNFGFSQSEWWRFFIFLTAAVVVQSLFAGFAWRLLKKGIRFPFWPAVSFAIGCVVVSYAIVILSLSANRNEISQQTIALPLYDQFFMRVMPLQIRDNTLSRLGMTLFVQSKQARGPLQYPKQALQCDAKSPLPNILLIVIDTWRHDMLTASVMPNLSRRAKQGLQFQHHISGGNATLPGLFSLFFSLPSTYWDSAREQGKQPVLFSRLKKAGYQFFLASSSKLTVPDLENGLFGLVKQDLHYGKGLTPGARDKDITQQFQQALPKLRSPFFGFLFYDAAHAYCRKQHFAQPFQPAIEFCDRLKLNNQSDPSPYLNRYRNALHFIDQEIEQTLQGLEESGQLENTIVLITGDHGQEFNDNQRNFWEHASNFSPIQIQTPLLALWPKKTAQMYHHVSTHYDLVPTLLSRILACNNPISDYSIGVGLFNDAPRDFIIVGSYVNLGIVERDRVTVLYPSGQFVVNDLKAAPMQGAKPRTEIVSKVFRQMRAYYQK